LINQGTVYGPFYTSPAVQQGKTYTIKVYVRNSLGFESTPVQVVKVALGKDLPPGNVPSILSAIEIGGELILKWEPAIDLDTLRYEWRYKSTAFSASYGTYTGEEADWTAGVLIDRVDKLSERFKGIPVGTFYFAVRAIDSIGNYSPAVAQVQRTITSDVDAFLQDHEFVAPVTLTNIAAIDMLEGRWKKRWETSVAGDQASSQLPNPVNSGSNPVLQYHTSASVTWEGESWDLGESVTGDWTIIPDITIPNGSVTYTVRTSPDGSTWTSQAAGLSWKGTTRYVRPQITSTTVSSFRLNAPPKMSLAAVTHSESGSTTSNAGSAKTISLTGKYVKAVQIVITPKGTTHRMGVYDNVVLSLSGANSFDVYIFDAAGNQVANDFLWTFEGF
jgi:hypothetical protein